jgi:hypothetical protein
VLQSKEFVMAPLERFSLEGAVQDLRQMLASDATAPEWRWNLRRRLSDVKEALGDPGAYGVEAWLLGREVTSNRCRRQLQTRVATLAAGVLDRLDAATITTELRRLQTDLEHYVQRLHDLLYDSVALELGGSE